MSRHKLLVFSLVAWCTMVSGADDNGHFAIKGQGLATCKQFMEARKARSTQYFQFGGWINGYISATNRYESNTFDIAPWQSTGLLAGWLTHFCAQNPEIPFVRAMAMMVNTLGKDRLTTRAETIEARIGDAGVYIYETILQRVQALLSERGHYQGTATGKFDARTSEALAQFQREANLKPTGLPDQPTLAKLFN